MPDLKFWGRKGGHFRRLIFEFGIWGAINKILGDGMIEVRMRWLMYRKATPDKAEDRPPKVEPWVEEDGGYWHRKDG